MKSKNLLFCKYTKQLCEHNCISNSGGYAGDDCKINSDKQSKQADTLCYVLFAIPFVVSIIIFFILNH